MPSLSRNFDARAAQTLQSIEQEDAKIKDNLYSRGIYRHIETPAERAAKLRERQLEEAYRDNFYRQFKTAADFASALGASRATPASPLRTMLLDEAQTIKNNTLPLSPPGEGAAFTGKNGNLSTQYREFDNISTNAMTNRRPKGPLAFVTIERGQNEANICLSHVPGANGGTPTNYIAEMADTLRKELAQEGYKGKNINFYIHVPKECANTKEILAKVEFEHSLLGGWKLKKGHPSFSPDNLLTEMPHALAHSLKDSLSNSPAIQNKDSVAVKVGAYRNFALGF